MPEGFNKPLYPWQSSYSKFYLLAVNSNWNFCPVLSPATFCWHHWSISSTCIIQWSVKDFRAFYRQVLMFFPRYHLLSDTLNVLPEISSVTSQVGKTKAFYLSSSCPAPEDWGMSTGKRLYKHSSHSVIIITFFYWSNPLQFWSAFDSCPMSSNSCVFFFFGFTNSYQWESYPCTS